MMINYQQWRNGMKYVHHSAAVWDANNRRPKVENAAEDISRYHRISE